MPGIEIKGRSKRANYRHGGRAGFARGGQLVKQKIKIEQDTGQPKLPQKPKRAGDPPEKSVPPKLPKAQRRSKLKGGGFPDHSGDGKITQKDILMAKGVIPKTKGKK